MYLVHTIFPYNDGNYIIGYVLNLDEFDEYVKRKKYVYNPHGTEMDFYGKGSKHYTIPDGVNNSYDLICQPLEYCAHLTKHIVLPSQNTPDKTGLTDEIRKCYLFTDVCFSMYNANDVIEVYQTDTDLKNGIYPFCKYRDGVLIGKGSFNKLNRIIMYLAALKSNEKANEGIEYIVNVNKINF